MTAEHALLHPTLSDPEFRRFQELVHREAGIFLAPAKQAMLAGRLRARLRELGLDSYGAYFRLVVDGDSGELRHMLDRVCTNETSFFREPRQFAFLEDQLLPAWRRQAEAGARPKRIHVWSAACSTGEEPYSLAMTLLHHCPPADGWDVRIFATDLSTRVLATARQAIWPLERSKPIPPAYLRRFMLKGTGAQEGRMQAGPELRSVIRFERFNLNARSYTVPGPFDLIFCRNVLIYFDAASKAQVIDSLLDHLVPTGYLFLGHAESLNRLSTRARTVIPTVYTPVVTAAREAR